MASHYFGKKVPLDGEVWKPVKGYEGRYDVSNLGRVRSRYMGRKKILKAELGKVGYFYVVFSVNGKRKTLKVHRLVAQAFCQNPNGLPMVNHKNEIKTDNRASNLEWCTAKYNNSYGTSASRRLASIYKSGKVRKIVAIKISTGEEFYFGSVSMAAKKIGCEHQSINKCLHSKQISSLGYVFAYQDKYDQGLKKQLLLKAKFKKHKRPVYVINHSNKTLHFKTILSAAKYLKASPGHVFNAIRHGYRVKTFIVGWD